MIMMAVNGRGWEDRRSVWRCGSRIWGVAKESGAVLTKENIVIVGNHSFSVRSGSSFFFSKNILIVFVFLVPEDGLLGCSSRGLLGRYPQAIPRAPESLATPPEDCTGEWSQATAADVGVQTERTETESKMFRHTFSYHRLPHGKREGWTGGGRGGEGWNE